MHEEKNFNKSMYLAVILSIAVIFITDSFFKKDQPVEDTQVVEIAPELKVENKEAKIEDIKVVEKEIAITTEEAVARDPRIEILNEAVHGSFRIKGARIDNIFLSRYRQTLDKDSPNVELLSPAKTDTPYYAEFGWTSTDSNLSLPNNNTVWNVKGDKLTPSTPIILEWNNQKGLRFIRKISIDENYMFSIEQTVENKSGKSITLYPYGLISKFQDVNALSRSVVHEGGIAVINNTLKEKRFKDIRDDKKFEFTTNGGWAGFTDRYWLSAIILNNHTESTVKFQNTAENTFQIDYVGEGIKIEDGSIETDSTLFFAGAKEIRLLDAYARNLNIPRFDRAIDFGWYYFLTKPFFYILDYLYRMIGNMGWAILLFALLLRLAMYPIASKSYESMSKMKKFQPKIKELQERYKDDKVKLQQETMNLYRKEKINPASGCLPLLIQIPVFFSLYKVLNIAIEIRHAPFIWWIQDLSAPDPLTLSVMLNFPVPSLIDIGVWPIIMGITMWIQQKLNPAPVNKDQARIFAMMPIIFTFMMGHFASGLVIYWTLSNVFAIIQQKLIMKKYGVK